MSNPTHRAKRVKRTLAALIGRLELFYLAGYSPELNLGEQVRGCVEGEIGRGAIRTKNEQEARPFAIQSLQELPPTVAGFSRHPEGQYTA